MLRMLRSCIASVAACVLTSVALPALQLEKRGITEADLFAFTWVGDPQISPDGSTIAFVKVIVGERWRADVQGAAMNEPFVLKFKPFVG
jgi:hypothetical protein